MSDFSWDWSDATGLCTTKDSGGYQHHCCSKAEPKYCPTKAFLADVNTLQIWSEGVAGDFHLEIDWLGAGDAAPPAAPVCETTEYCCPDAKACLTPTKTSCAADASACAAGQVCCPLTKICVLPGVPCVPPPVCKTSEYCCPDAKHCLTPTAPGKFCTGGGAQGSCAASEVCCPLTFLCVKVGPACNATAV